MEFYAIIPERMPGVTLKIIQIIALHQMELYAIILTLVGIIHQILKKPLTNYNLNHKQDLIATQMMVLIATVIMEQAVIP